LLSLTHLERELRDAGLEDADLSALKPKWSPNLREQILVIEAPKSRGQL
jgi:hypothetical protein